MWKNNGRFASDGKDPLEIKNKVVEEKKKLNDCPRVLGEIRSSTQMEEFTSARSTMNTQKQERTQFTDTNTGG